MVINLTPQLEAALAEQARLRAVAPEDVVVEALRERFLGPTAPLPPQDEWERRLLGLARNCGVSLSDADVSSEELYD